MTTNSSTKNQRPKALAIRDTGPYSTRNIAKGASIGDAGRVFSALQQGMTIQQVRDEAHEGTLLPQSGRSSRERIWASLHHRYLTHRVEWIIGDLTEAFIVGPLSQEFISLLYLHYALRDHLTYDFITDVLWNMGWEGHPTVSRNDVLDLLDRAAPDQPQVLRWTEVSRRKLANSIVTALRDFHVLEGTRDKTLVRPPLPLSTAEHLLRILTVEDCRGREVIEDPTWRLFMLTEQDVAATLAKLSREGNIHFEKVGMTVVLQTPPQWEGKP